MWVLLFAIVIAISLGLALGAVVLESFEERGGLFGRRPGRHLRATARYLRVSARP